ncbi:hypothetical protein N7486_004889 [Penicillium sp. IBT 16267x]|nr:hypothetical protein N7486_004889 [Penicillium sp. IBT 16267x]
MYSSTPHGSVKFGLPSWEIFKLPSQPHKVAPHLRFPPSNVHAPEIFNFVDINPDLFHAVIDLRFVLTFILAYVTTVLFLNQYNAGRQYRPWAISKSFLFKVFVFVHNVLLALFSAWVLIALSHGVLAHRPRVEKHSYYASFVEYMCQPDTGALRREFDHAFKCFDTSEPYTLTNYLTSSGSLVSTDAKGFRDHGSLYLGCLFYMSKYYEVVDTLIILLKGKKSSTLQTYHHAGVILCGWSAVTFESPVGVVGLSLNAAVHTLMTVGISIPMSIKRSLTGIQIAQFLIGMVWSVGYLFLGYTISSNTADKTMGNASTPALDSHAGRINFSVEASGDTMIPCISDSGEANVLFVANLYLLPLIYLFVQFFIRSYGK